MLFLFKEASPSGQSSEEVKTEESSQIDTTLSNSSDKSTQEEPKLTKIYLTKFVDAHAIW